MVPSVSHTIGGISASQVPDNMSPELLTMAQHSTIGWQSASHRLVARSWSISYCPVHSIAGRQSTVFASSLYHEQHTVFRSVVVVMSAVVVVVGSVVVVVGVVVVVVGGDVVVVGAGVGSGVNSWHHVAWSS